jgi:hypothetical protein
MSLSHFPVFFAGGCQEKYDEQEEEGRGEIKDGKIGGDASGSCVSGAISFGLRSTIILFLMQMFA